MSNKKKKRTSSYLLIFFSIIAVLLLVIILYLSFFRKSSLNSTYLAKNNSTASQGFADDETEGFTSGDADSASAADEGFISRTAAPAAGTASHADGEMLSVKVRRREENPDGLWQHIAQIVLIFEKGRRSEKNRLKSTENYDVKR